MRYHMSMLRISFIVTDQPRFRPLNRRSRLTIAIVKDQKRVRGIQEAQRESASGLVLSSYRTQERPSTTFYRIAVATISKVVSQGAPFASGASLGCELDCSSKAVSPDPYAFEPESKFGGMHRPVQVEELIEHKSKGIVGEKWKELSRRKRPEGLSGENLPDY